MSPLILAIPVGAAAVAALHLGLRRSARRNGDKAEAAYLQASIETKTKHRKQALARYNQYADRRRQARTTLRQLTVASIAIAASLIWAAVKR